MEWQFTGVHFYSFLGLHTGYDDGLRRLVYACLQSFFFFISLRLSISGPFFLLFFSLLPFSHFIGVPLRTCCGGFRRGYCMGLGRKGNRGRRKRLYEFYAWLLTDWVPLCLYGFVIFSGALRSHHLYLFTPSSLIFIFFSTSHSLSLASV